MVTVTKIWEEEAYWRQGWGAGPRDSSLRTEFRRSMQLREWVVVDCWSIGVLLERQICCHVQLELVGSVKVSELKVRISPGDYCRFV